MSRFCCGCGRYEERCHCRQPIYEPQSDPRDATIAELRQQLNARSAQLVTALTDGESLRQQLAARESELSRYMLASNAYASEVSALRAQLQEAQKRVEAAEKTITDYSMHVLVPIEEYDALEKDAGRYKAIRNGTEDGDCNLLIVSKAACEALGITELPVKCAEDVDYVLDEYVAGCKSFDAAIAASKP